jgi:glycosyltransferase involved in cell wall biosynthesis
MFSCFSLGWTSRKVPDQDPRPVNSSRLLFVVNAAWFFISHRLPIAEAARKAGYDVHIAAGSATDSEVQYLENSGFHFHRLILKRASRNPLHNAAIVLQLFRLYRQVRPRVVHHVTIKPVILGTLVARLLGIHDVVNAVSGLGYSFSSASIEARLFRSIVGLAYRTCLNHPRMTVIFQNPDDRADFSKWTGITSLKSVLIAGSGVDLDKFSPTAEPMGTIRIVLPARMLRDKGVVEFAAAIGQLRTNGFTVEGILAGGLDPENPENLTEFDLQELERRHGVRWIGHCVDIAALFSQTHIVCLPSYREGLPKALIEASAAGRAIVTTNVPGCRDVVEDGVTGVLVPPRQFGLLAEALEKLIMDSGLRLRLGRAARSRAEREFGIEQIVNQTLGLYPPPN